MVLISSFYYLAFNKPYGVLSQFSDPKNRETLKNYINLASVYPAGRLDYQSEGLLILSNNGSFIQKLTKPQYEHPKTYIVQIEGSIQREDIVPLQSKILLPGFQTRLADVQIITNPALPPRPVPVRSYHATSWLKIILKEGKKHLVRKLTAAIGFPTLRLFRIAIGNVILGELKAGQWRMLFPSELNQI